MYKYHYAVDEAPFIIGGRELFVGDEVELLLYGVKDICVGELGLLFGGKEVFNVKGYNGGLKSWIVIIC